MNSSKSLPPIPLAFFFFKFFSICYFEKTKGGGGDLDEFMALEQIREKEEELKKIMIYLGRPGLWQDWQRFQAEARKSRRYQEKMAEKRKQELIEYAGYGIAFIFILFFAGILAWLLAKWMGKI